MPRAIDPLVLPPDQRGELQRWAVALGTPQQVALRCRIVLAVAAGKKEMEIAAENGVNRKTVRLWRERFRSGGLRSLWEIAPGRGRKPSHDATRIKTLIDATLQTKPKGSTHWSCPDHGGGAGDRQVQREPDLAQSQHQATSHHDVQAVTRPEIP